MEDQANPRVLLSTSLGDITVELDTAKAPVTSENFLAYVASGHYDGTIFHRVIPDFMIQGGGFAADMRQKSTSAAISNEADNGLKNPSESLTRSSEAVRPREFFSFIHNDISALFRCGVGRRR